MMTSFVVQESFNPIAEYLRTCDKSMAEIDQFEILKFRRVGLDKLCESTFGNKLDEGASLDGKLN